MYRQSVVRDALLVMHPIFQILVRLALYARLFALAFYMQAGGYPVPAAHADETSESLYPGRYVTNCKPAPTVGCVCETDSAVQTPQLAQNTNDVADHNGRIRDIEYLRMIEWMRLTCNAVTQSGRLR
jgi:hypothetical protein